MVLPRADFNFINPAILGRAVGKAQVIAGGKFRGFRKGDRGLGGVDFRERGLLARLVVDLQEEGQAAADEANHGADGEIDAAGDDNEGDADADDAKEGGAPDEVFEVERREEGIGHVRGGEEHQNQQSQNAKSFFHVAGLFRVRVFSVAAAGGELHNGLFVEFVSAQFAGEAAFVHHQRAVAHAEHFFHFA